MILKRLCPHLHHSPFLPIVLSQLLTYLDKCDTLRVIQLMIEDSSKMLSEDGQHNRAEELRGLRWYFPLDKKDFISCVETFVTFMSDRSKSVKECLTHLESIEINVRDFIHRQFSSFFLEFIPLDIINTMFTVYLNEGIKILFRIGYSFFKLLKTQIINSTSREQFEVFVKETISGFTDDDKRRFVKQAFHLRIVKIKKQFSLVDTKGTNANKSYICLPAIIGETKLLLDPDLISKIYDHVPSINKANDLERIYSTWADGRSLTTLISRAKAHAIDETVAYLLIVQTDQGSLFGAYLQHDLLKSSNNHFGSSEDFVFTLIPSANFYPAVMHPSTTYYLFDGKDIYIGPSKSGCAILLGGELIEGHSGHSSAFDCDSLCWMESGHASSLQQDTEWENTTEANISILAELDSDQPPSLTQTKSKGVTEVSPKQAPSFPFKLRHLELFMFV